MDTKNVNTKSVNANGLILAIDLGKYKSVACAYERVEPSWQLTSFTTNREELLQILEKYQPAIVVFEACALCGWVRDLCAERGLPHGFIVDEAQLRRRLVSQYTTGRQNAGGVELFQPQWHKPGSV